MTTRAHALLMESFEDTPHVATVSVADPAGDEVLIEVEAASINAFDWKVAEGALRHAFEYDFPVTLGRDYSGVVRAVGQDVRRVQPGDAVLGYTTGRTLHRGAFTTHLLGREDDCFVVRPDGVPADVAAGLPLSGIAALRCINAVGPLHGQRLLVVGAPGGVGSLVVQMAASRGAYVIATGAPSDEAYLRGLGAAEVVEPGAALARTVQAANDDGLDALIDLVDRQPALMTLVPLLRPGSRLASAHGGATDEMLAPLGISGTNINSAPDRDQLDTLATLVADGRLRVPISERSPFTDSAAVLADARDAHSRGKRVLLMTGSGAAG